MSGWAATENMGLMELGRPIVTTSHALAAGFLLLVFSNFTSHMWLGFFSSLIILVALVVDLTLTPILMLSTRPRTFRYLLPMSRSKI